MWILTIDKDVGLQAYVGFMCGMKTIINMMLKLNDACEIPNENKESSSAVQRMRFE